MAVDFVKEAYLHYKPIAAAAEGRELLSKAEVPTSSEEEPISSAQGVLTTTGRDMNKFATAFIEAIAAHRHFDRQIET
jgi:catalase